MAIMNSLELLVNESRGRGVSATTDARRPLLVSKNTITTTTNARLILSIIRYGQSTG